MHQFNCFTNILEDLGKLRGLELLTDERIDEIKKALAPESFGPVILNNGRVLEDWILHIPTSKMYNETVVNNGSHYFYTLIYNDLLTKEEVDQINRDANRLYREKREKERFEKAKKITAAEWDGPVYCDETGFNDGYFSNIDEFLDWAADERESDEEGEEFTTLPKYVWACDNIRPICHLDYDSIVESATEEAYEGWETDQLKGETELRAALDKFNDLNKDQITWYSTETIAILL